MRNKKEVQLSKLQIISHAGKNSPDFSSSVISLQYYESILELSVKAAITYVDTGQRNITQGSSTIEKDDANLQFAEQVYLELKDDYDSRISFTNNDNSLILLHQPVVLSENQRQIISISLASKEYLVNSKVENRVRKTHEGRVSDIAKKVLTNYLKTKKPLDIEQTLNKMKVGGTVDDQGIPFETMLFLCPRSVPEIGSALGKTAGFFFFETSEGYKFKSIDKLLEQQPKAKLIVNETTTLPPGYTDKILSYETICNSTYIDHLKKGTYGSALTSYDPYKQTFIDTELESSNQEKTVKLAANEYPQIPDFLKGATRRDIIPMDIGYNPPGSTDGEQASKSTEINFDVEKIYKQARMRYNQLFAIKMIITIQCDLNLHAGDTIECYFPEVSDKVTQLTSPKISGKYLIADLCHYITPNGPAYTKMGLIRDSFG